MGRPLTLLGSSKLNPSVGGLHMYIEVCLKWCNCEQVLPFKTAVVISASETYLSTASRLSDLYHRVRLHQQRPSINGL